MLIENPAREIDCEITFKVDGSSLNVTVTPAYCASCRNQVDGFFHYQRANYGQVGTISCNHCGMEIHCTNRDSSQDAIFMIPEIYTEKWSYVGDDHLRSLVEIDFQDLYQINSRTLMELEKLLQEALGEANFLSAFDQEEIELLALVEQTCTALNITELPNENIITDERFHQLPANVNKWLNLLQVLTIIK
ncbi:hypothetical protein [Ornithinibacillus contaminans]|uniref:hypothetical protein n=1 Tax=Ornithinibacillus contaminans TaxID=694055 RepID=UPI0012EE9906|nr:hypothetical protein [Ornithinibacillus contaminans]